MVGGRLRLRSGSAPIPRNAQPQLNAGPAHVVANFLPCPQLLRCWLLLTDSVSLQNAWPGLLLLPSKILAAASMAESAALVGGVPTQQPSVFHVSGKLPISCGNRVGDFSYGLNAPQPGEDLA